MIAGASPFSIAAQRVDLRLHRRLRRLDSRLRGRTRGRLPSDPSEHCPSPLTFLPTRAPAPPPGTHREGTTVHRVKTVRRGFRDHAHIVPAAICSRHESHRFRRPASAVEGSPVNGHRRHAQSDRERARHALLARALRIDGRRTPLRGSRAHGDGTLAFALCTLPFVFRPR